MFQYTITLLRAFPSLVFACFVFLFFASSASAASYEVSGWGWGADNNIAQGFGATVAGLGWISFSNKSDSSAIPYGVFIDTVTGDFFGYAWSSNAGWITFNAGEMKKCSTNLNDNCVVTGPSPKAHLDTTFNPITGAITGGTGNVTGWARACSVFVSGCSGTVRPDSETGTWDGWLSLSGTGYGLNAMTLSPTIMKFRGPNPLNASDTTPPFCPSCFAWGGGPDIDADTDGPGPDIDTDISQGFGWGINLGGLDVSLVPSSVPPLLSFWADQTTLVSGQSTSLNWITSTDILSCTAASSPSTPIWNCSNCTNLKASTVKSKSTGPITAPQTYTLECENSLGVKTPKRTVNIALISVPVSIDGTCGAAAGVPSRTMPVANLCKAGNAGVVTQVGNTWEWPCNGLNVGTNASCVAPKKKTARIIAI